MFDGVPCTAVPGGLVISLMELLLFCSLFILNKPFETELNKSVEMSYNILLLSPFSFPCQIPKWDVYFRLLHRFTIAEASGAAGNGKRLIIPW